MTRLWRAGFLPGYLSDCWLPDRATTARFFLLRVQELVRKYERWSGNGYGHARKDLRNMLEIMASSKHPFTALLQALSRGELLPAVALPLLSSLLSGQQQDDQGL